MNSRLGAASGCLVRRGKPDRPMVEAQFVSKGSSIDKVRRLLQHADMQEAELLGVGIGWSHTLGHTIDRPNGHRGYSFCYFRTPVMVRLGSVVQRVDAGACILFQPESAQWYRGITVGFVNDWIDFRSTSAASLIRELVLPIDKPFMVDNSSTIANILADIQREYHRLDVHWREIVSTKTFELLVYLARGNAHIVAAAFENREDGSAEALLRVRHQVHENLELHWRVPDMAILAHLSTTRFSVRYRSIYGTSPMDDLIAARMARARTLLGISGMSVREVANRVGYRDPLYFSRLFRRRTGLTPTECRTAIRL